APKPGERRYYIYAYDWRQDNVESARGLDRLIESIRRDYGDPMLRVDIVAHSMGGLVARYYQRYGTEDVLDGRESQITLYGSTRTHIWPRCDASSITDSSARGVSFGRCPRPNRQRRFATCSSAATARSRRPDSCSKTSATRRPRACIPTRFAPQCPGFGTRS